LKAWLAVLGLTGVVAVITDTAPLAQPRNGDRQAAQVTSPSGPAPADQPARRPTPHRAGELECRNCHRDKHQGVVQMYIGIGGRGTPTIPSHMFQVRVECVACHIIPRADETADLKGQTFRPSEQACVNCHGEKFRGMLQRWTATLTRMTAVVTPKLKVARDALESASRASPKTLRARTLVDDAEFNVRYVSLAKGVHNVFYAADLLKLSNSWLDEATSLLGKASPRSDDQLVRGGYCAALCHELAKVKVPESVMFGKQRIPHARHVTELGATCTSCHSAETHKAVTATAATCTSCHHSPQNERCESCHRAQAVFYRGETKTTVAKVTPNLMAASVPCTACHDWSARHSRAAVGERCLGCHDASYTPLLTEWTAGFDADLRKTAEIIQKADVSVSHARRVGRRTPEAEALLREARDTLALVRRARPAHNPLGADALLRAARERAEAVLAR
jgi:hypothetical protein